jgi:hypothetical protein
MAAATQKIIIHADDQTGAAIASAIRNSKKLDSQLKTNTNNMRGMTRQGRAQMAQLGHQMQDVAVQLQMGMNPLMILGQQGSQVASIFGAKGAVYGSLLAVAALIGGVFFKSVMKGADAAGEYADNLIKAAGGIEKLSLAQKQFVVEDMNKKLKEMKEELVETQKRMLLTDSTFMDFIKGRKYEGGNIPLLDRLNALFTGTEALGQQAQKSQLAIDSMNDSIAETNRLVEAQAALEAMQGMPMIDPTESDKANKALSDMDKSMEDVNDRARILENSFKDVGAIVATTFPMAREEFTTLNLKVEESQMAFRKLGEDVKFAGMNMDDVGKSAINSLEDSLVDLSNGTKSASEAFRSMARSIINDLIRMNIQRSITAPLFNGLFGSTAPTIATAPGYTTIGAGSSASAAGSVAHFEGGGYTGMGGRSGGVDGRGGFPAILHPNETVIDHNRNQTAGGNVTINMNISTGVSATVRAELMSMMPMITNSTKNAVLDARRRGGAFAATFGG